MEADPHPNKVIFFLSDEIKEKYRPSGEANQDESVIFSGDVNDFIRINQKQECKLLVVDIRSMQKRRMLLKYLRHQKKDLKILLIGKNRDEDILIDSGDMTTRHTIRFTGNEADIQEDLL